MRQSHTAIIERDVTWTGAFETEPYEAAWASEAIYFIRLLAREGDAARGCARVQISPDGMHWCDEGTSVEFGGDAEVVFVRVSHFGSYLRLTGDLPAGGSVRVMGALTLKS